MRNIKLKSELTNDVYNVIDEAIKYMYQKQNYKNNDIIKLITAISTKKYKYITNENDYRQQVQLLCEYFQKEYNHALIGLMLIKNIINKDNTEVLEPIINEKNLKEYILYLIEKEDYEEMLNLIENNRKAFLAFTKSYELTIKGN